MRLRRALTALGGERREVRARRDDDEEEEEEEDEDGERDDDDDRLTDIDFDPPDRRTTG